MALEEYADEQDDYAQEREIEACIKAVDVDCDGKIGKSSGQVGSIRSEDHSSLDIDGIRLCFGGCTLARIEYRTVHCTEAVSRMGVSFVSYR